MAKKKSENQDASGTEEIQVEGSSVDAVAVTHPGEDANEEFLREQNEALLRYKATGQPGVYIDPLRDQEPDIAPEFGVSPHPEMANPAPPEGFFTGRALNPDANPVVAPLSVKEENSSNRVEEYQEQAAEVRQAREDAEQAREDGAEDVLITSMEEGQFAGHVADESPKAANSDVRA